MLLTKQATALILILESIILTEMKKAKLERLNGMQQLQISISERVRKLSGP